MIAPSSVDGSRFHVACVADVVFVGVGHWCTECIDVLFSAILPQRCLLWASILPVRIHANSSSVSVHSLLCSGSEFVALTCSSLVVCLFSIWLCVNVSVCLGISHSCGQAQLRRSECWCDHVRSALRQCAVGPSECEVSRMCECRRRV